MSSFVLKVSTFNQLKQINDSIHYSQKGINLNVYFQKCIKQIESQRAQSITEEDKKLFAMEIQHITCPMMLY